MERSLFNRIVAAFGVFMILSLFCPPNISWIEAQSTGAGEALQLQLDNLQAQIDRLNQTIIVQVNRLDTNINVVNANANAAKAAADAAQEAIDTDVIPAIETHQASIKKLNTINQTWKKNFIIINSTIQALKKKVALKAPYQ